MRFPFEIISIRVPTNLAELRTAVQEPDVDVTIRFLLAAMLYEKGAKEEAAALLDIILPELQVAKPGLRIVQKAYYLRGLCRKNLGQTAEAARDLKQAASGHWLSGTTRQAKKQLKKLDRL